MSLPRHLIVFVKEPRLGRVKSRLAKDIGAVAAWGFYLRTVRAVLRRLGRDRRWEKWLAVTPDRAVRASRLWPAGWRVVGQGAGDLGVRMARPMGRGPGGLPPGPAVLVGSDIPDIARRHVIAAFRALGSHEAVFGPAADGGFWLVGFRRRPVFRSPFSGVRWSSPHALADALANLGGRPVALVETLSDVDDGAALKRRPAHRKKA